APAVRPSRRRRRPPRGSTTAGAAPRRRRPAAARTGPNKPTRSRPVRARPPVRSVPPGSSTPPSVGRHRPRTRPFTGAVLTEPASSLTACDEPGVSLGHHSEPVEEPEEEVFGHLLGFGLEDAGQVPGGHGVSRLLGPEGGALGGVGGLEEVVVDGEPLPLSVEISGHGGPGEAGRPRPALR